MKAINKFKMILFALVFILLFFLGYKRVTYVFREKHMSNVQETFAKLKKDSVDMIFIGTSHQFCNINTDLLYEEYGINSFMLATSAQTVPMSYYAAWEAVERQHPETIVFEVLYCANNFRTVTDGMSHVFFDGMPWGEAKKKAIEDLIPKEERIYYYLDFGFFHTRWKELKEDDFRTDLNSARGNYTFEEMYDNWDIPVLPKEEKAPMTEEMQKYLDLLIDLCAENDVELILYVAPYNSLYNTDSDRDDLFRMQRIFNWMEDYAAERGVPFYNLFYELDEIGFDPYIDWKDSQHLNRYGQAKLTRYMVEKGYLPK